MIYHCCDQRRRRAIRGHPVLNGIDYVEVLDADAVALGSPRQRTLLVRFVKTAPALAAENFEITGGERIDDVEIEWATRADAPDPLVTTAPERAWLAALPDPEEVIALRTNSSGDHSTYTLHLVATGGAIAPPADIDPLLARVGFSFKVECASDYDCAPKDFCGEPSETAPQISYLAKDYGSFRRMMLDRMALTLPQWSERNAADLGIALVEVLAYVGDRLSYAQDAVATEAYLGTARRRISVRRHARLVDYAMHDGANARAWVQVRVRGNGPVPLVRSKTKFLTKVAGAAPIVPPPPDPRFERLHLQRPLVFEPCEDKQLFTQHNEIFFYEWGEGECCLPKGATRATLDGDFPNLAAGDVLVFEEILGPHTGRAADADLHKRCAVRLVQVAAGLEDPLGDPPTPITEIRWAEEDALPFALCLSARTGREFGEQIVGPVSHVLGNIVLADHGLSRTGVLIGTVPEPHLFLALDSARCAPAERKAVPPRFAPVLAEGPLTQSAEPPDLDEPASTVLVQALDAVRPQISLDSTLPAGGERWVARRELLNSDAAAAHFAVEVEADGRAQLRFGDDRHGKRPASGTSFQANYRVGNGAIGNIGADALAHVVTGNGRIEDVRNPLPARGGREPESAAQTRAAAPQAFRVQERAVTPGDYAAMALRHPGVQRAAATFRWNGHGHTVFVTVDRFGGRPVTEEFEAELMRFLEPFRMAGYDLEIDEPQYVSLEMELLVCAKPGYFRSEVKGAVQQVLDDGVLPDGELGLFHPDRLTFDQDVHLSAIIARVQAIDGVESVTPLVFRRQGQPNPAALESGVLTIGRLEIARLANDPSFPERGKLTLKMGGGK